MDDGARGSSGRPDLIRRGPRPRPPWNHRRRTDHDAAPGGSSPRSGATYAALDLGTNNCRLLVARPTYDSFRVVCGFSRIIRLGEGVSRTRRLSEAAIGRALEALAICRDRMHSYEVSRARLIATEACRAAENGAEFLELVKEKVGIALEIVDRETEARLASTGCTPLIDPQAEGVILFDIGGGSSEIVLLRRGRATHGGPPEPQISGWASLPVGVVTLAERYGGVEVGRELFELMVAHVGEYVSRFAAEHGGDVNLSAIHMLGTSGTVTTVAGVHLGLPRYERRLVDGCWMQGEEISRTIERLLAMTYEQRIANPCIGAERADLVLAGCAILESIRRTFPCKRLRVADRGLREGILVQLMREDRVWSAFAGRRP